MKPAFKFIKIENSSCSWAGAYLNVLHHLDYCIIHERTLEDSMLNGMYQNTIRQLLAYNVYAKRENDLLQSELDKHLTALCSCKTWNQALLEVMKSNFRVNQNSLQVKTPQAIFRYKFEVPLEIHRFYITVVGENRVHFCLCEDPFISCLGGGDFTNIIYLNDKTVCLYKEGSRLRFNNQLNFETGVFFDIDDGAIKPCSYKSNTLQKKNAWA